MSMLFTCSFDDGYPSDLKVADLLNKYGFNGTFFVPLKNRDGSPVMEPAEIRALATEFEIGSHTYDHCYLESVNIWDAYFQIAEGKKQLEDLLGEAITGFCYPGGKYGQRDIDLVRGCGFSYARTITNLCFDAGHRRFEMPTTVQFFPHHRDVYLRNFASSGDWLHRHGGLQRAIQHEHWIDRIHALFDYAYAQGRFFHLWGHSKEIDELDAWGELDAFFARVADKVPAEHRLSNNQLAERCFHPERSTAPS
jgi:peptidoglycan-N-acetylglucosamine deacetylase